MADLITMEMVMETAGGMMGKVSNLIYPFIWLDCYTKFGKNTNMSAVDGINKSGIPVMVIHGRKDTMIGYDKSSIISKKNEITNPKVKYYTIDGKYSGHSNIFYSYKSAKYLEKLDKEYDRLSENYKDGEIPDSEEKKFFDNVDKALANEPNEKMFDDINNFFEAQL